MAHALELQFASRVALHLHRRWLRSTPLFPDLPRWQPALRHKLPPNAADEAIRPPRLGRHYPSRLLHDIAVPADLFRVVAVGEHGFMADFNPALAGLDVSFGRREDATLEAAGDRLDSLLRWAGMEAPLPEVDADFGDADAYAREDEGDDADFYATPRRVLHVDGRCAERLTALYAALLPPGVALLDLMSGWRAHLPPGRAALGLGMNAAEMADNPQLRDFIVHDLNREPALPFRPGAFGGVTIALSFEYLTAPLAVLREIHRVLGSGGIVVVSFSTRFFPPKAIRLWTRLHPMERVAWVADLLRQAGFARLHTLTESGLERDPADRYANRFREMDPLFAVWGYKG